MEILKEKKLYFFRGEDADENIALVIFENDVHALLQLDGIAIGSDGKRYYRVSKSIATFMPPDPIWMMDDDDREPEPIPDTDLEPIGWTTEATAPVILPADCARTETE